MTVDELLAWGQTPASSSSDTNTTSTSSGSFWDGLTSSSIYSDFLKPYAQKELGLTEQEKKQNEANVQAYNDIKQNVATTPKTYGGFTMTQLAIGGAGLVALVFILKR